MFTLISCVMYAQSIEVSGTVVAELDKSPIVGATVFIAGTSEGRITDAEGKFTIKVKVGDKLEISSMGYQVVEETITAESQNLIIQLKETAIVTDDVVVVGFGTQKKESVVSSVSTIKPSELKVPSSNLTTALGGRIAGMMAVQTTGEPGRDGDAVNFFVRGAGSFEQGVRNPLILIDGAEMTTTDFARLQPDDIESFSVMKDATAAAVYGSRGANGVIVVTTKQGKEGKAKINIRYETSVSMPTRMIDLADNITYMELHNEAIRTRNPNGVVPYSDEKIARTAAANANRMVYPSVDWYDMLFKNSTVNQRINFNVSGGGAVARYYISGTYNRDNGILKNNGSSNFNNNIAINQYSLRTNFDINATKTTRIGFNLQGEFNDYTGPLDGGDGMYNKVINANPVMFPAVYDPNGVNTMVKHTMFGNYGVNEPDYTNPYAEMVRGYKQNSSSTFLAQLSANQDLKGITEGLSARMLAYTKRYSYYNITRQYNPYYYRLDSYDRETGRYALTCLNETSGSEALNYSGTDKDVTTAMYFEGAINYDRTFKDKHAVTAMMVYTIRNQIVGNAGSLEASLPTRNMGLAGRFTYGYDSRYFFEVNFGYNGSERFDKKNRWGFFPSVGFGWLISNEPFYGDNLKKVLSNLKIKATYGLVGNDNIGSSSDRFFYMSNVNLNDGGKKYSFGTDFGYSKNGISTSRYANADIKWETAYKTDIGIEIGLFDKLQFVGDYFYERRDNVLLDRAFIPSTAGFAAGIRANVGSNSSEGFDASLDYNQTFGEDLWISGRATFTYATSRWLKYEEPEYKNARWRSRIGQSQTQTWGYVAERLFVDDYDVWNSPTQNFGGSYDVQGGDIKYRDINNDGIISEADQVPIGFPTNPEVMYGFGASIGYKGFDFSFFFQGSARSSFWIDVNSGTPVERNASIAPFIDKQRALIQAIADSHWSEENPNSYAFWPRLSEEDHYNNRQTSTWWMRNGSFLRLKQVELGYTLPEAVTKKMKMQMLRIYVSANNVASFSKFKLWDTEMGSNGLGYPIQLVINGGIQIGF